MMGTFQALSWAYGLKNISTESKLMAFYIASLVGQTGVVVIDVDAAAEWCGFVSMANRIPRRKDVRCALQELPGISYAFGEGDGGDGGAAKITVTLGGGQ